MFCLKRCNAYRDGDFHYGSYVSATCGVDFDLRVHDNNLVCPPIDSKEALDGLRVHIWPETSDYPTMDALQVDVICAAHVLDGDKGVFAVDALILTDRNRCIALGTRIVAPAAWNGVLEISGISYTTEPGVIVLTASWENGYIHLRLDRTLFDRRSAGEGHRQALPPIDINAEHSPIGTKPLQTNFRQPPRICSVDADRHLTDPAIWTRPSETWRALVTGIIAESERDSMPLAKIYERLIDKYPWFAFHRSMRQCKCSIVKALSQPEFARVQTEDKYGVSWKLIFP
ncbi:hypothetical protein C8R47DRAFT_1211022 [Mycena vitilis]|nr:hypothetical protein C8R47DRAFT_1211022 [Mycena vitilis]